MKNVNKFLSVLLTLITIVSIIPMSAITASADAYWGDVQDYDDMENISGNYEYAVISEKDKTCIIEEYRGTDTDVIIPSEINGYTVTELYTFSFQFYHLVESATAMKSITIPKSITKIHNLAICRNENLETITVDSDNEYYSNDEFGVLFNKEKTTLIQYPSNNSRTNYNVPDSVTKIGNGAFYHCTNLTSVTIPDNVTLIGNDAFSECTSLTNIIIPNGVTSIGSYAFYNCDSLASITIPDGVTSIGSYAFYDCDSLTSITIPDGVTSIDWCAFECCDSLNNVYYSGTEEQWNNITINSYNDPLINAIIHYNFTGCVHTSKIITIPAKCTVAGMSYNVCEICGEIIGNSTVIPATGHTAGEWEVVLAPTYEADGKQVKKCTVCGDVIAEETIPMLVKNVVTDENTGVSMEFDNTDYNGVVDIVVEESFDGIAFDVIDTSLNASQKFIYDITMTVDSEAVQPNGTVTVRIPLPEGYDPTRSFVYHIDTETGKVEKMPATYENGYLVFETTHFSYYAVVEECNYSFSIQNPSKTEIRNKDGIILHANVEGNAPAGFYVKWESNNGNFSADTDGNELQIIAKNKGWTTFTAILCDADGNELACDSVEMYSKSGFFDKIGGFFRGLFGLTKIYEN